MFNFIIIKLYEYIFYKADFINRKKKKKEKKFL